MDKLKNEQITNMDDKFSEYKALIDLTKTTEDLVSLQEEIDMILQSLFHVEVYKLEEVMEKFVRIRVAAEIEKLLKAHPNSSKEDIKVILSKAYRTICTLPILRLTMAFEPSEMQVSNISYWARSNLEQGILLDLSLDRSLIGGLVITYKGKYYDFSLKNKLKEIFEKGDLTL